MNYFEEFKKLIADELGDTEILGYSGERELCVKEYPTALSIHFTEAYGEVNIVHLFDHEGDYVHLPDAEVAELERLIERTWEFDETESDDEPDGMDIRKMRLEDGY